VVEDVVGVSREELAEVGAKVGSDVPFFVYGGTALVEGRGERVTALPDVGETWVVLVVPEIRIEDKTRRMYGALGSGDFGDGRRTDGLVQRLKGQERVRDEDICNAFERAAYESFDRLAGYREAMMAGGAEVAHLSGAGPALFSVFGTRGKAEAIAEEVGRQEALVYVTRTLEAEKATRVVAEGE
jgi:4-diphosphocytidyl-2-C-methyl-D-erythritol kinase